MEEKPKENSYKNLIFDVLYIKIENESEVRKILKEHYIKITNQYTKKIK